jgi:hypothetical protein
VVTTTRFIILLIPKIIIKIIEVILTIAEIALKLAEMAVKIALCLALSPIGDPMLVLNHKHHISLPKLAKWLANVKILRVYEIVVAGKFEQGALSLMARADFVFLSRHLDLGITFSLDFKDLVAGFAETLKDLVIAMAELFGDTVECVATLMANSKPLVSLGWSETPHPPEQQQRIAEDGTLERAPKLSMGHDGQVVHEVHVDNVVANFAKRHAAKLGPRARLSWVAGTPGSQGKSVRAVLGVMPVLAERVEATTFEGDITDVEETELGVALRWEHEAHVTAVAAAAAALKAGGEGPAAAVAAHALGVALDSYGHLHIAPEWRDACVASNDSVALDAVDHCGATAYAAAVSCSGVEASKPAARACAAALSSLASKHCAGTTISTTCVAKTADALSCSATCSAAVIEVSNRCGGFMLRGEHGDHAAVSSEECSHAVRAAQSRCSASEAENSVCISLLEAVPAEEHATVHADAADDVRAHAHHRQATLWREQHARGVIPTKHLCGGAGHLDLRDNVLLGSVPACAWMLESGRSSLLLSRNMLSGNIGKLGAHVTAVHVNENKFTGSLDDAFSGARDLEIFDVAHNRLSGDLGDALSGIKYVSSSDDAAPLSKLRMLHVEGNALTDTKSRPVVHTMLSKIQSLKSYDISGNNFTVPSRLPPAQEPVAVHAVLHIDADTRHLCPGVPFEGFALNCGEMLADVDQTNIGALDCAVQAAAEAALPDNGDFRISLRRERVMPFKSEGTIISFTIHVARTGTSTYAHRFKKTATEAVASVRDAIAKLSESKNALRMAATAGGCPLDRLPYLSAFPVKTVDARLGCAPGLHGASCRYACMGRWDRHDETTPAPHDYYAEGAEIEVGYVSRAFTTEELITNSERATAVAVPRHTAAGLGEEEGGPVTVHRRHLVHHWEGEEHEKHLRAVSLRECTVSCRGHANRALGLCHQWLDNRGDVRMRRQCSSNLKDMGEMCGVTLRGATLQCGSYVKPFDQADVHDCQVCGIHRFFEQHGAYGGGQSHFTTYDLSVNSNGRYTHNAVHLSDPKRKAKAIAQEEAAKSAALGLTPQALAEPSRSHLAGAAEEYVRSQFAEHAPREAISRAVNDGTSNAYDAVDGEDDASHLAELHDQIFGGMTVRTAMNSQFASCRGDERCSEACVLSTRSATDTCIEWLHAADADSAECSKSIDAARVRCSPEERIRCLEPLAAGFHALGVPGGEMAETITDPLDDEDVGRHSRSLLNAAERIAGEIVMGGFPAAKKQSASYPGDESSWPSPEFPVRLMTKGKRNFDLVSSVCRPAGITEQEIAMVCMKHAKWVDGGITRVALGWDDAKSPQEKDEAKITHELMDESDAPNFDCNIPYLGLDYNSSLEVELEVIGGHVQCGAEMQDGQKVIYDFYVEARMKPESATYSAIYPRGIGPYRVGDVRVRYHAYGKTQKDIEMSHHLKPEKVAASLVQKDFASAGYSAEAEFHVLPDVKLTAAYNVPSRDWVMLNTVTVEFDGPAHALAPRVSRTTATLQVTFEAGGFNFSGVGQLPFPLTGDRPLVARVTSVESGLRVDGTIIVYPNAEDGASYATLRTFINNTYTNSSNSNDVIALALDFKRVYESQIVYSGMTTTWDTANENAETVMYVDGTPASNDTTRGDAFVYIPGGEPASSGKPDSVIEPDTIISVASNKRKAEGCRSVLGGVRMKIGAINPGRGGHGMLPNPLRAPVWGTMSCKGIKSDPDLVLTVVASRYAPWPDDPAFVLFDVVIKLSVTMVALEVEESALGQSEAEGRVPHLNDGNLVGTLQASMDMSSQSAHGLPPLGGWAKAAMTFYASGGDLREAYRSSSWSVSGVLDSRLGDVDRPYARIVAPFETELPCEGVIRTVGSVFANVNGVFRLQAENVPMNISCGGDEESRAGEPTPSLMVSVELDLLILPPDAYNKISTATTSATNRDDGGGIEVPFMKTMMVTVRHVRGPVWYWDGDLVAQIGGKTSALKIGANATFQTKNGFPPDALVGMSISYEHETFDIFAAASFPMGACYDPYRYYGLVNIHPTSGGSMSNVSLNASLTQYCQRGDGTTEYFFTAQITDWDVVPGTFGILHGLVEGTLIRAGNAGRFKYWSIRLEGTIGLLGASDGNMPDFGHGVVLSMNTQFGSLKDEFRIELKGAFQIEGKSSSSYFKIVGTAEFTYPCVLGERIGALVDVVVDVGDMNIPGISGSVFFHCKVNGPDSPVLEAEVRTHGVVQFVKGYNLDDFVLLFNAFKDLDAKGKEEWLFAGSVSATMAFGDRHGASIDFMFDTRHNTWGVAVGYEMTSPNINMTLKAGVGTHCTPAGQFLKGAVSINIGEEGRLYGSARGAKHCGDYRLTKGVINVRAAVDEAMIKTDGMLLYLENIELRVRGDTRDVLIAAEGFMEAQAELPVSDENPYLVPEPGYGRRLLAVPGEIDPRITMNYRTNCFQADTYNEIDPLHVFTTMNNETSSQTALDATIISWTQSSRTKIPSVACQEDSGDAKAVGRHLRGVELTDTLCAAGEAVENDASHPVCPDDLLMSAFMFTRDDYPGCKCAQCYDSWQRIPPYLRPPRDTRNVGNKFAIAYNCVKQPIYAVPIGECRTEYEPMMPIKQGGGKPTDLKLLEAFTVSCGADSAFRSFQTTTHTHDKHKIGWKSTCCKLPPDAGPLVKRNGTCFYTALPDEDRWRQTPDEQIMLNHLMRDKGVACGPGEALTAWTLETCEEVPNRGTDGEFMSRFVWTCRYVGGIHSPPPFAPPPPVDDSIENLDWSGDFSGRVHPLPLTSLHPNNPKS